MLNFIFCGPCKPDIHPNSITSSKCRVNTVVSTDDGRIVARNMWRLININILKINCAPSWFYFILAEYCYTNLLTIAKCVTITLLRVAKRGSITLITVAECVKIILQRVAEFAYVTLLTESEFVTFN